MELRQRKNMRLDGYDYSSNGTYFITICVENREEILWNVGARIARPLPPKCFYDNVLSEHGMVVNTAIENISVYYPNVCVDKYVIMPNHIHLILIVNAECNDSVEEDGRAMRAPTISNVINQMKGYVTKQIGFSMWQKLFHDRIIRNEREYQKIWKYINDNPSNWQDDCFYGVTK